MDDREEKKEGKIKIQKFKYLKNENSFLDDYQVVKNKNLIKNSGRKL